MSNNIPGYEELPPEMRKRCWLCAHRRGFYDRKTSEDVHVCELHTVKPTSRVMGVNEWLAVAERIDWTWGTCPDWEERKV